MYNNQIIIERLETVLNALARIPRRFAEIKTADNFLDSDNGIDKLDAICMILVATGEAFKQIDQKTNGEFLSQYPQIDWRGIKGIRNVIAHAYFDIDAEQVFNICRDDIPMLIQIVKQMINDINQF